MTVPLRHRHPENIWVSQTVFMNKKRGIILLYWGVSMNNVQILEKTGDFFGSQSFFFPHCSDLVITLRFWSAGGLGTFLCRIWGNFLHQEMSPCLRVLQSTVGRFSVFVCWSCVDLLSWLLSSRRSKYYDTKDEVATFFIWHHMALFEEELGSVEKKNQIFFFFLNSNYNKSYTCFANWQNEIMR